MSCAILLAGYLAVTAFMANMKLFAVFICVYLLGAPLGFVRKVNNEIERLLAIKDSEKMADDVSSIFIREHKTTYKTCWILIGISFLLILFQILVRGVDIPNALFFFGLVQLSICTIWTFKRAGGAVLMIMSMFSKMLDESEMSYITQTYEQAYEYKSESIENNSTNWKICNELKLDFHFIE